MSAQNVNIPFPIKGLVESTSYALQPPLTTPSVLNVRPYTQITQRFTPGPRAGLAKHLSDQIAVGDIQNINLLVPSMTAALTPPATSDGFDPEGGTGGDEDVPDTVPPGEPFDPNDPGHWPGPGGGGTEDEQDDPDGKCWSLSPCELGGAVLVTGSDVGSHLTRVIQTGDGKCYRVVGNAPCLNPVSVGVSNSSANCDGCDEDKPDASDTFVKLSRCNGDATNLWVPKNYFYVPESGDPPTLATAFHKDGLCYQTTVTESAWPLPAGGELLRWPFDPLADCTDARCPSCNETSDCTDSSTCSGGTCDDTPDVLSLDIRCLVVCEACAGGEVHANEYTLLLARNPAPNDACPAPIYDSFQVGGQSGYIDGVKIDAYAQFNGTCYDLRVICDEATDVWNGIKGGSVFTGDYDLVCPVDCPPNNATLTLTESA